MAALKTLELFLSFSVIRVSVAAISTLLTGVMGINIKNDLAGTIGLIFGKGLNLMPTNRQYTSIQSGFLLGLFAGAFQRAPGALCHIPCLQALKNKYRFLAINHFPAGLMAEVVPDISLLLLFPCNSSLNWPLYTTINPHHLA